MKQALFILLLFALFLQAASSHTPSNKVMEIQDSGFIPLRITLLQGDSIEFKNTGSRRHWPASDLHPTHTLYPGSNINKCGSDHLFDSCRGLAPGESWNFTFTHAGTWRCHDHLDPQLMCTIIVEEDPDFNASADEMNASLSSIKKARIGLATRLYIAIPSMTTAFILNPLSLSKDDAKLLYWLSIIEPKMAMRSLLDATGNGNWEDCHQQAHQIGRISYQLHGAGVFKESLAQCHSGFYHGAMERLLFEEGFENLTQTVSRICNDFQTDFGKYECFHGIGHGILAAESYDLPKALEQCDNFNDTVAQGSCYSGAFMENIIAALGFGASKIHETQWVSDDPHFPCNAMNSSRQMQERCYQMQTSWMLDLFDNDFERVIAECKKAPEAAQGTCFQSFGRDAAGETLRNPKRMKELCYKIEGIHRDDCVMGSVNVIIDFWGDELHDQASKFCALLDSKEKDICYQIILLRLGELFADKNDWIRVCNTFGDRTDLCERLDLS